MKMKEGYKTTEFWLTLFSTASGILGTYGGLIPTPWGLILSTIVTAGYTISRGLAKQGQ
ncbi:MAG: hypothetical protein HY096_00310 [Nitrospinae bacterium]|nr:hypothetical protein [Nitrospinota bacterium]